MGKTVKKIGGSIFGGGGSPGIAGTGRYKGTPIDIDKKMADVQGASTVRRAAFEDWGRAATQSGQTAKEQNTQRAARQRQLDMLERSARGEGPSLAEAQMRSTADRSLAQQLAAAGRARGNQGAVARQLARQQAASGRQLAQDAATARIQEQQQAQQALQAGLTSAQQAEQARRQLETQAGQAGLAQALQSGIAQQQALSDLERLRVQQNLGVQGLTQSSFDAAAGRRAEGFGGMMSGLAGGLFGSDKEIKKDITPNTDVSVGKADPSSDKISNKKEKDDNFFTRFAKGMDKANEDGGKNAAAEGGKQMGAMLAKGLMAAFGSDKDIKKDIKPNDAKDFLDKLKAYDYNYKNPEKPGQSEGRKTGVMAQDLEKSKMGKQMVEDTPEGKMVNMAEGYGAVLAAQANLNKRLKEIESKMKKPKKA